MTRIPFFTALMALIVTAGASSLQAQNHSRLSDQEGRIERQLSRMTENLDLSEDQVEAVRAMQEEHHASMQEIKPLLESDEAAAKEKIAELHEERKSSMREILTEEQYSTWESTAAERGERGHHRAEGLNRRGGKEGRLQGRHKQHDPAEAAQRMQEELELTDSQTSEVEAAMRTTQERMQSLAKERSEESRQKHMEVMQSMEQEMQRILTEEQFSSWKAKHDARRSERKPRFENNQNQK